MKLLAVFTTVGSKEDAQRMAIALVERKLVACAQISAIDSVYRWKGQVEQEPEFRLLLKTTQDQYPAVETAIRAMHPYELPAIFALPVEAAVEALRPMGRGRLGGQRVGRELANRTPRGRTVTDAPNTA